MIRLDATGENLDIWDEYITSLAASIGAGSVLDRRDPEPLKLEIDLL